MLASSVVTVVTAREMCREQNNAATPTDKRRTVRQAIGPGSEVSQNVLWEEPRDLKNATSSTEPEERMEPL